MPETLYTAEDLYTLDGDYELDEGVLVPLSQGKLDHGLVCGEVYFLLSHHVREHRLGKVFVNDSGFVLGRNPDTVRGPDVAFVSAERLQGRRLDAYWEGSPDLAVEVISPGDRAAQIRRKVEQYHRAGCPLVWLVYPKKRQVVVQPRGGEPVTLQGHDILDGGSVLPGFRCKVSDLFAEL